ncbi:MAG: PQQ-dependent dehydrogenase, methanol/ethanol family, partial [Gemmatimonadales bacterium]
AKTGRTIWTYDPKVPKARGRFICCDVVNRGLALYRGKVYVGTLDGRLVAIDTKSGAPVWTAVTTDTAKPYAITGAPRIAKGKVLIGNAGAEYGVRGYVTAYDAETGKQAWRTYTVPGDPAKGFESKALEVAVKTWKGTDWTQGAGGTPWDAIVYDPDLDLVYVGTGNGTAWYRALRSKDEGDNLYVASILALRGSTGEQAWYYQVAPGDNWDYDATQPLMLADLTIGGKARKVIMQAPKTGFFYVLDRETGEFLSAEAYAKGITWTTGIDKKTGRPVELPEEISGTKAFLASPDPSGAHNWNPIAYSPATGLVYLAVKNGLTALHAPDANWKFDPKRDNVGFDAKYEGPLLAKLAKLPPPTGELVAWNPVEQRAVWRAPYPVVEGGGVLATAGNLVFQGRSDGILGAYNAKDGKKLWEYDAGTGIMAPPVTYLVDGVQYITLMAGWGGPSGLENPVGQGPVKPGFGRILTIAIGGSAKLSVSPYGHKEPPVPAMAVTASKAELKEGGMLYGSFCAVCHGDNAVSAAIPDLRYSTAETHRQFEAIVLGGARDSLGMTSWKGVLTSAQVHTIEQYVLNQSAESAKKADAAKKAAAAKTATPR